MDIRIRDVPPDVHRELKVIVAQQGTSIQAVMLKLIREYIAQHKQ